MNDPGIKSIRSQNWWYTIHKLKVNDPKTCPIVVREVNDLFAESIRSFDLAESIRSFDLAESIRSFR